VYMANQEFYPHKNEGVWQYFLRERSGQSAKCKLCDGTLKTIGGSTKGLHTHLETKHKINVRKKSADATAIDDTSGHNEPPVPKQRNTLDKYRYLKSDELSLPSTLARMTACDGMPFLLFTTSTDLRRGLHAMGFRDIPKSPNGIHNVVMNHAGDLRAQTIAELASLKKAGVRFSVSLDEWTSGRNRRYMNVNVHKGGNKFWNIGLVRVHGRMPAERCVELLRNRLNSFGLHLEDDIVCIVTDGASLMKKVGKLISPEQQLCYAHGIHLAVLDVLYKRGQRQVTSESEKACDEQTENEQVEHVEDNEEEVGEEENTGEIANESTLDLEMVCETEEIDESDYAGMFTVDSPPVQMNDFDIINDLLPQYQQSVETVRKVVKVFRKSPTKNDEILQPYIITECGHEVHLKLDCKTRWNSLLEMLSTFLRLRIPVQKALLDMKQQSLVSDTDFENIQDIVVALDPVRVVVEALCSRDTTLLSADVALKLCISELDTHGSSELATATAAALRTRLRERRHLAGVLRYLHDPNAASDPDYDVFTVPSTSVVRQIVFKLLQRLNKSSFATGNP